MTESIITIKQESGFQRTIADKIRDMLRDLHEGDGRWFVHLVRDPYSFTTWRIWIDYYVNGFCPATTSLVWDESSGPEGFWREVYGRITDDLVQSLVAKAHFQEQS